MKLMKPYRADFGTFLRGMWCVEEDHVRSIDFWYGSMRGYSKELSWLPAQCPPKRGPDKFYQRWGTPQSFRRPRGTVYNIRMLISKMKRGNNKGCNCCGGDPRNWPPTGVN